MRGVCTRFLSLPFDHLVLELPRGVQGDRALRAVQGQEDGQSYGYLGGGDGYGASIELAAEGTATEEESSYGRKTK